MVKYGAFCTLMWLTRVLPIGVGHRLALALGELSYWLNIRARRNVTANLRQVLPAGTAAARRRSVARGIFRTGALNYYDLFRVPDLNVAELAKVLAVRGWEHMEAALAGGKGVVVVSAHLGNLEVVGQITAIRSVSCIVPVENVQPDRLMRLMIRMRNNRHLAVVPLDGSTEAVRRLFQALRRNEAVAIIGDRNIHGNGVAVTFFGKETLFPSGAVALALRSGVPLLPVCCLREGKGFSFEVAAPVRLQRTGDSRRDIATGTQLVAKALEKFIGKHPEQWAVFEAVWPAAGDGRARERAVEVIGRV